jgi:carbonic anhydrase
MSFNHHAAVVLLALAPLSIGALGLAAGPQAAPPPPAHSQAHAGSINADEAMKLLTEGNERFVSGHPRSRAGDVARRAELTQSQSPYAVIVCCSDSRVGPELVFDSGLGDLFVIRTAGEVFADPGYGSIEYAVDHLHTPLVVVVGHERCGAISAAVAGGDAPGHIASIVKALQPAVQASKGEKGDAIENAVKEQVREVVARLQTTGPILSEQVHDGKLKIVGACYDLDTGKVEMLPAQKN